MPSHGNFGTKMNLRLVMLSYRYFKKKSLLARSHSIVNIVEGTTYILLGNTKTPK